MSERPHEQDTRARGLVAIGDSITRGSGDAMLGLRMQSWALWLAEALGLPYTCLARDGAQAADALAEQVPRLRGPYDLGCLYIGVNDVRAPGFQLAGFASTLQAIAEAMARECARLLFVLMPPALGVPPAPALQIVRANTQIARLAQVHRAPVMTLESLAGPELVQPDAVHLTARGEAHMALLACELLARVGLAGDERELRRALEPVAPLARARYMLMGRTPARLRDMRRRARESLPAGRRPA